MTSPTIFYEDHRTLNFIFDACNQIKEWKLPLLICKRLSGQNSVFEVLVSVVDICLLVLVVVDC